jgi:putative oxidoreductase
MKSMSRFVSLLNSLDARFAAVGAGMTSLVLLLFRLLWGFGNIRSGYKHFLDFEGTTAYFASLHIPYPATAVCVSATAELIGGAMLMLGFRARLACVPLFINFTVAYLTSGRPHVINLLLLRDADKFIGYPALPYLMTSLLIFAFGPGKYSLDHLFFGARPGAQTARSF